MDVKKENESKPSDDIFPDCWKDDVRMNSLFAPFRKRSANPLDWDSKLKFWKSLIEKWCAQTKRPVFTVAEVISAFERKGRRAHCLPDVVSEIIRSGEGCRLSDFERGAALPGEEGAPGSSGSWAGWAVGVMVRRPLAWAVGRLWSGSEGSTPVEVGLDEPILLMSVLKDISNKIMESGTAELVDVGELQKSMESKESFRLALLLLQRRGLATTTTCGQRTLVKLASENDKMATSSAPGAAKDLSISEVERSAYVLTKDEMALQQNIEKLEEEKRRLAEEARGYVRKGMRQLAKSSLRKRHAVEQCIEKRVQALENVQSLLHRVKEAETDGQVLESYKLGVAALKKTLSEAGLTEDTVENTKAELEDVLELHGDLTSALADMGKFSGVDDEEQELEDELAQLLSQQQPPPESELSSKKFENKEVKVDKWGESIEKRLKTLTVEDLPTPPSDPLTVPSIKVSSRILSPEGQ